MGVFFFAKGKKRPFLSPRAGAGGGRRGCSGGDWPTQNSILPQRHGMGYLAASLQGLSLACLQRGGAWDKGPSLAGMPKAPRRAVSLIPPHTLSVSLRPRSTDINKMMFPLPSPRNQPPLAQHFRDASNLSSGGVAVYSTNPRHRATRLGRSFHRKCVSRRGRFSLRGHLLPGQPTSTSTWEREA